MISNVIDLTKETNRVIIKSNIEGELFCIRNGLNHALSNHLIILENENLRKKLDKAQALIDEVRNEIRVTDNGVLFEYEEKLYAE